MDAIIASTDRQSVFGEVAVENAKRISIRWDLPNVKGDPQEYRFRDAHLVVRLTIQKASGAAVMTVVDAQNRGFDYRAEGRCKDIG